jgi:hypothetical protein
MEEKLKMSIFDYYQKLSWKEKSAFMRKIIVACEISNPTIYYKLRKDSWTKLEREAVIKIIENDSEH